RLSRALERRDAGIRRAQPHALGGRSDRELPGRAQLLAPVHRPWWPGPARAHRARGRWSLWPGVGARGSLADGDGAVGLGAAALERARFAVQLLGKRLVAA